MKFILISLFLCLSFILTAQPVVRKTEPVLIKLSSDGRMQLSDEGASYFANLSLDCTAKPYPHFYYEKLQTAADLKVPDKMWPSF